MSIGFYIGSELDLAQQNQPFTRLHIEASPVCESVVEKLPTAMPEVWFSPTLLLSRLVPGSVRLTSLVDTDNGNGHSSGIGVANGIRYCVGETVGG